MSQPCRLESSGLVDRRAGLSFTFDGRRYEGYQGDTLASALLANGVHLVARSFKYHRPRGIMGAGAEEPNALVEIGRGGQSEPNLKATQVALYDGLEARSVNAYPSVRFDLAAAFGWASPFLAAGFYYKTFFGSPWLWRRVWEPMIRRAGGWGRAPGEPDPDTYDHRHHHCDLLVVGGGPAGLAAALAASRSGARVVLADEQERFGGSLLATAAEIDGEAGPVWADRVVDELASAPAIRLLPRTTVFGAYDGNYYCALERIADHLPPSERRGVRQRVWHIRAARVLIATGAHERPIVFPGNDRPGIMLAGAVEAYLRRWAVKPGRRMVLFTNNDRAYETVFAAHEAGTEVAAVVDARRSLPASLADALGERGIPLKAGYGVSGTSGTRRLRRVEIRPHDGGGVESLACDLLAVSGGFSPVVHLFSQSGGRLAYDEATACLRPVADGRPRRAIGGADGTFDLATAIGEGLSAGTAAACEAGFRAEPPPVPAARGPRAGCIEPLWITPGRHRAKAFVDHQNDTTADDIRLAVREGFDSVEHLKRYTLTGFGTDQGKTSNINALGVLAQVTGRPIGEIGTTTFRPPYTPVTFAALGGRHRGVLFEPERLTPMHDWHVAQGALFEDVGQWKRAWYYPRAGEDMAAAVARECRAARERVGILDASTLGKIDIQGPDAAEFLNRVYTNGWKTLAVGRVRYGIMCGEDGMVFDDGTTARIADDRYLMTTTTGGAARVLEHLEEYLQTEWPDLRVRLTSVTEEWANVSLAGPRSRDVLAVLAPGLDLSPDGFPFLGWQDHAVAGLPARIFRISFTGELQYEINVPWHLGQALWDAAMEAGAPFGITPYGTETMHVLRAEKGFIIAGQETDGTQTPEDLGLGRLVSTKKDFIGRRSLVRPDCVRPGRKQLVGLLPNDRGRVVPEGAQLIERSATGAPPPVPMLGYVTSSYWSAALERGFCLALVADGRARHGDTIGVALPEGSMPASICDPVLYDPQGARRDGD